MAQKQPIGFDADAAVLLPQANPAAEKVAEKDSVFRDPKLAWLDDRISALENHVTESALTIETPLLQQLHGQVQHAERLLIEHRNAIIELQQRLMQTQTQIVQINIRDRAMHHAIEAKGKTDTVARLVEYAEIITDFLAKPLHGKPPATLNGSAHPEDDNPVVAH